MRGLRRLRARIRYRHYDSDLAHELAEHRELKEAELRAAGISAAEARTAAARALGNITLERERARGIWLAPWLESVWQDIRYALRTLTRTPAFSLTALATLTLALSVNVSFFGLVNGLVLRPWPVPDPKSVVTVFSRSATEASSATTSPVEYRFLRDASATTELVAIRDGFIRLDMEPAATLNAREVSGNYFSALRMPLELGRGFTIDEDQPGRPVAVAVIGHAVWRERFAAAADVPGRTIRLNGVPFTVIGVATSGATDSPFNAPDVWVPLATIPLLNPDHEFSAKFLFEPRYCCVLLAGRLKPGATHAQAEVELSTLDMQFRATTDPTRAGVIVTSTNAGSQPGADRIGRILALIGGGLVLLLTVACANLGNLQLARTMARRPELAIRQSLGAGRARIVRQLLTEATVLAAGASIASLAGAAVLPRLALEWMDTPAAGVSPDVRVLAVTLALALFAIVVSTLAAALRGTRRLVIAAPALGASRLPLRSLFLGMQIALGAVLLVGAGLLTRSVVHAATLDLGYAIDDVERLFPRLPPGERSPERMAELSRVLWQSLVDSGAEAAQASLEPLTPSRMTSGVRLPDEPQTSSRQAFTLDVSPGYFAVLRLPFRDGRAFTDADGTEAVVINESLAGRLWPGQRAVGRTFVSGGALTVIGVVADAYLTGLEAIEPMLFRPTRRVGQTTMPRAVLLRHDAIAIERARAALAAAAPGSTITVRPLTANLRSRLELPRLGASIASVIGLCAVGLSAIGVFGVFAYAVGERTREIGIRMALGARGSDVLRSLLGLGWPILAGLAAGLGCALIGAPVLRSYLYGISPHDPLAFGAAVTGLVASAAAASTIPARRAMRVDPARTLRTE